MQQKIPDVLLLVLVLLLSLPAPPCAATSLTVSWVFLISEEKSWLEAVNYCRNKHTDLVTIRSESDADKLASFEGWIGLRRRHDGVWRWSKGSENPSYYAGDFLSRVATLSNENCVYMSNQDWDNRNCWESHPFLCVDERLILVREMKTWENALVHCRKMEAAGSTPYKYTLARVPERANVCLDRETTGQAETEEVWVALRFLAGKWTWLNGELQTSFDLPQCPAQQQHCGALVHGEENLKAMDCAEKRHFICRLRE